MNKVLIVKFEKTNTMLSTNLVLFTFKNSKELYKYFTDRTKLPTIKMIRKILGNFIAYIFTVYLIVAKYGFLKKYKIFII